MVCVCEGKREGYFSHDTSSSQGIKAAKLQTPNAAWDVTRPSRGRNIEINMGELVFMGNML